MRRLIWLVVMLAVVWGLWWAVAAWGVRSGLVAWFDARRADGWQAEVAGPDIGGFPARVVAGLNDLALADPATGLAVSADRIEIAVRAIWPGDVTVRLPATPMRIATPEGRGTLQMEAGVMALELVPERALGLDALGWTAGAWAVAGPDGGWVAADGLRMQVRRGDAGERYGVDVQAPGFAPGPGLRSALRVPADWPLRFDALVLDADVTFDRAWDLRALEDRRPQPRRIDLNEAEVAWGDLRLRLAAGLDVDAQGVPTGTAHVRAENWPVMLDLAVAAGLLPARARDQVAAALTRLAGLGGDADALDIQVNFAGGFMAVGIIPVGRAPRFILR